MFVRGCERVHNVLWEMGLVGVGKPVVLSERREVSVTGRRVEEGFPSACDTLGLLVSRQSKDRTWVVSFSSGLR